MLQVLKDLPREKIQLATKFGLVRTEPTHMEVKGNPEYVRSCCEATLKRLDVEYIDLYYPHRIDTSIPIEETVKSYIFSLLIDSASLISSTIFPLYMELSLCSLRE